MFGGKQVTTDPAKIDQVLTRGVSEIIPSGDSLKKLLLSGKKLRIKLGIDPTSPNLHVGRSIPLLKLKDFQDLGHQIVFIIGDATGVVGDTSDKDSERPMLSEAQVKKNLETYVQQVSKILDKNLLEIRRNSEWLLKLNYRDIGEHADMFSVSDFISRDNIKRRLDEGKRVSLREVLYPLMQGYDSVAVKADVELGGTDQRFNLLAGRTLQEKSKQAPQHIVMTELILGTDGRKMSSSWGNTINLNDEPKAMFEKGARVPDSLVETYFLHATRMPLTDVKNILSGTPHDRQIALAHELVRMYHGEGAAKKAKENYLAISKGDVPEENVREAPFNEGQTYTDTLTYSGYGSRTAARRLIEGGGLFSVTKNETVPDWNGQPDDGELVRLGRKGDFLRLKKNK
jgi:tyrosyl-tRNA synthetase